MFPVLARHSGIDERILRDELSRGPRPMPIRPASPALIGEAEGPRLSSLEREALTLLLVDPVLAAEQAGSETLPLRDESARALWAAWSDSLAAPDEARPGGIRRDAGPRHGGPGARPAGIGASARRACQPRDRSRGIARRAPSASQGARAGASDRSSGAHQRRRTRRQRQRGHQRAGTTVPGPASRTRAARTGNQPGGRPGRPRRK